MRGAARPMLCGCLLTVMLLVGPVVEVVGGPPKLDGNIMCLGDVRVMGSEITVTRRIQWWVETAVLTIPNFHFTMQLPLTFCWGRWSAVIGGTTFAVWYVQHDPVV